ncbi:MULTISPECIES: HPP family protein [Rheinheimera]|uniref:HPP family protein n=1 Tax=Rheinheimera marina TaxID=1774958 RepID=A0ABV9JNH0_9GAMM
MQHYSLGLKAIIAGVGATAAIAALSMLQQWQHILLMAPFGATAVILFALPDSPLARPLNVIGGHFLATLVALVLLHQFGQSTLVTALAVGISIGLMVLLHITHPPAGATALLVMLTTPDWWFLLNPVLTGSTVMVVTAWCYHHSHQLSHGWFKRRRAAQTTKAE